MQPLFEIRNASFGYGIGKTGSPIVSDISLILSTGEFVLLIGPNGCGKSTIIRGLFNLVHCFSGNVIWHIAKGDIGYIPQESNIDHDIPATALDVVCTSKPFHWHQTRMTGIDMLKTVGMENYSHERFGALSGGQKRRILLARALFGNPKLLVLDEPTVNTDLNTEKKMETVLTELCEKNRVGILATTHSANWAQSAKRYRVEKGTLHE